jgi:hypothetical protein
MGSSARSKPSNVSYANGTAGSQVGSQSWPMPGHVELPWTSIIAAQRHARPHWAMPGTLQHCFWQQEALIEDGHVLCLRGRFQYRPPGLEAELVWLALGTRSPMLARSWLLGKRQIAQVRAFSREEHAGIGARDVLSMPSLPDHRQPYNDLVPWRGPAGSGHLRRPLHGMEGSDAVGDTGGSTGDAEPDIPPQPGSKSPEGADADRLHELADEEAREFAKDGW